MATNKSYIDKDALVAEIERRISNGQVKLQESQENNDYENYVVWAEHIATCIKILSFIDTLEVKEIDLELITHWFDHIAQIADDRKTANSTVMEDWAALDEIKCLAKNSSEFIKMHYKSQKGE